MWFIGIQPAPKRAVRRSAGRPSPPTCTGGPPGWTGLGSKATASKSKNRPWCSTVGSVHSARHTCSASSTRGAAGGEVQADGVPLLTQPTRADPEVEPATRDDVEGGGRAGADERVTQPDVVDVGAEPDRAGLPGQIGEVGDRVVHRRLRRNGRMAVAVVRAARHRRRQHQVLGQPHRFVAEFLGADGELPPQARMDAAERDSDLHPSNSARDEFGSCRGCGMTARPLQPVRREEALALWRQYTASLTAPPIEDEPPIEQFGDSAAMADELAELVLAGIKRASADLPAAFAADRTPLPRIGGHWIVCDGSGCRDAWSAASSCGWARCPASTTASRGTRAKATGPGPAGSPSTRASSVGSSARRASMVRRLRGALRAVPGGVAARTRRRPVAFGR